MEELRESEGRLNRRQCDGRRCDGPVRKPPKGAASAGFGKGDLTGDSREGETQNSEGSKSNWVPPDGESRGFV